MPNTPKGIAKLKKRHGQNFFSRIGKTGGKTTANRYFHKKHKLK